MRGGIVSGQDAVGGGPGVIRGTRASTPLSSLGRRRPREEEALPVAAAELAQPRRLVVVSMPSATTCDPSARRHRDDRRDDRAESPGRRRAAHERAVDLQRVDREAVEVLSDE